MIIYCVPGTRVFLSLSYWLHTMSLSLSSFYKSENWGLKNLRNLPTSLLFDNHKGLCPHPTTIGGFIPPGKQMNLIYCDWSFVLRKATLRPTPLFKGYIFTFFIADGMFKACTFSVGEKVSVQKKPNFVV